MVANNFGAFSVFLTVAEERSFTGAAKRLGVSPSAVSRELERDMDVRLLSRTTRSVAPTGPGEQLLSRLRPAFEDIREAQTQVSGLRNKPAGRVRLLVPRVATHVVLAPKLSEFARDYPDIVLDVTTDDSRMDIVAGGFDAGIHFGKYIEKDMITVRVSPDVGVSGPLIVDDLGLVIRAAVDGVGLAYMLAEDAAPYLAKGGLVRVLEDWCQPFPGFFLYYPSRRQQPAALSALIHALRL